MNQSEQSPTPEELNNLENDAVWALLDEATPAKANSAFVSNVMEQIQSEDKIVTSPSFWKRYAVPLGGIAAAGIAACVMLAFNPNGNINTPHDGQTASTEQPDLGLTDAELATLAEEEGFTVDDFATATTEIDQFTDQMIEVENEDPFIMTADEISVLVSM